MEFTREQLQLLVDCAPEITVVYLTDDRDAVPVPFLYTSDTPAFSGLMENEYLELYRDDATKIVLPQDLPTLRHAIRSTFENRGAETCTYRTFHKVKGMIWTHAALKWIGTYEGKHRQFPHPRF